MNRRQLKYFELSLISILLIANCSKKITNGTPVPQSPPQIVKSAPVISDDNEFRPVDMNAQMKELLVPIYFEYNQSTIRDSETPKLEKIASFLNENGRIRVLIEGHCDERGSSEYNIGLGEKRARAVQTYLSSYGIPYNRIETASYGKERPAISGCDNEHCYSQNRRDEWKVLNN
jgi:peptidoglycan-associated lipoprotein